MDGSAVFSVADALADVATCVSSVVSTISGNPVLMAYLGIGLVTAAAGLFSFLKLAAR